MRNQRVRQEAGFTFAELAFGFLILVISAAVLINHLAINYQVTATERDRVFAYTKAQAILSEIQAYVDRGEVEAAVDLDVLDDGVVNKPTLSIQEDSAGILVPPNHVVSSNVQRSGQWLWSRRITVQPFAGVDNRNVRYVTVRVYKKDNQGTDRSLADLSAVINSSGKAFPATQVFDIYMLAIENIPGWWVFMDSMKPFVESMLTDLETRNPGLAFRPHWITKAAFGRNQLYRPYTNDTVDSHAAIPDVYHYPGRMPAGNASSYYYVPDNMRARINCDGVERNGYDGDPANPSTGQNPHPYALADFFNHAMRHPDELALWRARVADVERREQDIADALANGVAPPPPLTDMSKEPTMRLLLDGMHSTPDLYRNALVINLHGELLPMPALRNYSDAAKSPAVRPNLRAVTHPEQLHATQSESLQLRMYAYLYQTSSGVLPPPARMVDPMVVEVVGLDLRDTVGGDDSKLTSACNLANVPGGVSVAGSSDYASAWQVAKHRTETSNLAEEMHYFVEWVPPTGTEQGFTRIYLFNTPTTCPQDVNARGLAATKQARLHQMDYVPCPITGASFTPDLTSVGSGTKNTARWTLRIAPSVLSSTSDLTLQIRTRIATNYSTSTAWQNSGTVWPTPDDPDNLSVTYAWWSDSTDDVPFSERAQFNGDPRHLPYSDCFNGGEYPNAYNWYHHNLNITGENAIAAVAPTITPITGISTAVVSDGWGPAGSLMSCDAPRYFQMLRESLVRAACVYTSMTGWSYYYMGIGNDIGYDSANGYPNSIPSNLTPQGSPGVNGYINTITGARRYAREGGVANYWWGMPWLGELYPDSTAAAAEWLDPSSGSPRGNLDAGTGAGQYYQDVCNTVHSGSARQAFGTAFPTHGQRAQSYGCTTLFNIGSAASTFQHSSSAANGTLSAIGNEIAANYNMTVPSSAPISRPWRINAATTVAQHWAHAPYATKYNASIYQTYYSHVSGTGSGLIKLSDSGNTSAAYIVVNGISNAVDNGTTFIAKYALVSLVHSFFEAGSTTNTLRIPQQPRIEIESPTDITELNDPATISIQYGIDWSRWDELPYSATGTFAEDELQLQYVIMYSNDGGTSWYHVQDDSPATPGIRPTDPAHIVDDSGVGTETYDWDVPQAQFPEGSYQLRIDCFRSGAQVHYSYHRTRLFVQR